MQPSTQASTSRDAIIFAFSSLVGSDDENGPMADGNPLRIACRLVCTDQWLVTHVDPSWSILQLKRFLLHKFHRAAHDVDDDSRTIPVSPRRARRRSLSPITFAAPLRKPFIEATPNNESSLSDCSGDLDFDDDVDITKTFTDTHRYKYNTRPSTSSASESAQQHSDDGHGHDAQHYVLLTFSTTQILEDRFSLSWYSVHPNELFELHPASVSFASLSRCSLDAYIAPYFAARVWALRIVGTKLEQLTRHRPGEDDAAGDIKTQNARDKGKRKVAVEWKERWTIIHQGVFSLSKERHDTHTAFSASLSSLLSIQDSTPFHVPLQARRLRKKAMSSSASNVVCMKFSTPASPRRRTFSNELSVGFEHPLETHSSPSSHSASSSTGGWWRRSRDVSSALSLGLTSSASVLVGSGSGTGLADALFSRRGSRSGLDDSEGEPGSSNEKGKGKERDEGEDAVWIVLDMLDSAACSHILRILHRHAPLTCQSTFLPTRPLSSYTPAPSPIIFSSRSSTPATFAVPPSPITPGPSSSYTFPPPLSPTVASPYVTPSYASSQSHSCIYTLDSKPSSPTLSAPPTIPAATGGPRLAYPAWRLSLVRAARRAGLGAVGRAMELVMFGDEDENDLADIEDADEEDDLAIEWARRTSSIEPSPIDRSPTLALQSPHRMLSPPRHRSDPAVLSHARLQEEPICGSREESDPSSEPEPDTRAWQQAHLYTADVTSLNDTEPDAYFLSDGSEAEWDGWVDAVIAQRKADADRARARRAALARSETLDTAVPSSSRPTTFWGTGWANQYGGASNGPPPSPSVSSPDPEEDVSAWQWMRENEVEADAGGPSAQSSDSHTSSPSHYRSPRATSDLSGRRRIAQPQNAGLAQGQGKRTLSTYSSMESLLRRTTTTRTSIKDAKIIGVRKRGSIQVLFPSATGPSGGDVRGNEVDLPARSASESPPLPPLPSALSRPSFGSMRSATSTSSRARPLSPLSSQLHGAVGENNDDDDRYESEDGPHARDDSSRGHADVEEEDEDADGDEDRFYASELSHPVPLPGMRMVPAGYTTFQHSSLYGQGGGGASGEERTHAGMVHGQSMQRLPMGMSLMMTTVSSTVSVGARRGRGRTR